MNKKNKIYLVCLIIAGVLLGGVLVTQAAGFFSYEDGDKFILWANVRMVTDGLMLTDLGVDEPGRINGGNVKLVGKDLLLRGFMGFNCTNYPSQINCDTTIGNIGGRSFLRVDRVGDGISLSSMELQSQNLGIMLRGDSIRFGGNIILNGHLVMVNPSDFPLPAVSSSVFVPNLRVNTITNNPDFAGPTRNQLIIPNLKFVEGAIFNPQRIITIDIQ